MCQALCAKYLIYSLGPPCMLTWWPHVANEKTEAKMSQVTWQRSYKIVELKLDRNEYFYVLEGNFYA